MTMKASERARKVLRQAARKVFRTRLGLVIAALGAVASLLPTIPMVHVFLQIRAPHLYILLFILLSEAIGASSALLLGFFISVVRGLQLR